MNSGVEVNSAIHIICIRCH